MVASDLHPSYSGLWPLARRAWIELGRLEPILVLVADPGTVPEALQADPAVHVFEPIPGLHTAFQAQCIRLLYPALVETNGAVVVSDVDMVPLSEHYLARPAAQVREDHFVAYRDVLLELGEMPICYNAARPATWSSIFSVRDLDDVRSGLSAWAEDVSYAGVHGGAGWTTDQRILHRTLLERGRRARDVWILDDYYTRFRRLERAYVEKWRELSLAARNGIAHRRFTDFHLLPADSELAHLNVEAIELAIEAGR